MPRDVGMADRLRAAGLKVVEVDGWRTRGSDSFFPKGVVVHHTAGAATGNMPSLGILIRGRSDVPGPLCNVGIGRDNTVYVIAAGRANHAGRGGWRGLMYNSSVHGIEVENVGTSREPWRPDQIETAAKVAAVLLDGHGPADNVCEHKEWTSRKVDRHSISGADTRRRVAGYLSGATPFVPGSITALTPDYPEDDMKLYEVIPPSTSGAADHKGDGWILLPFKRVHVVTVDAIPQFPVGDADVTVPDAAPMFGDNGYPLLAIDDADAGGRYGWFVWAVAPPEPWPGWVVKAA
ncbi:MAG TPA: peptidoglycan recognition family protein [Acidimicrobiales bacterium]|nr:peptidoglycan recognition family protein [Acidimicrobiales bacterium]